MLSRSTEDTPTTPRSASRPPIPGGGRAGSERSVFRSLPPDDWTYDGLALGVKAALDQLVVGLARSARSFVSRNCWTHFGYARSDDHARETLGRSGRWLRDLAALGAALERLPGLESGLAGHDGSPPLGQVAALAIARIASVESIDTWMTLARSVPVRTLKDHVRAAREAGSAWPAVEGAVPVTGVGSENTVAARGHGVGDVGSETIGGVGSTSPASEMCTATLQAPPAARELFDDTRLLHSAVCGRDEPAVSLVETLIAETNAGLVPIDADIRAQPKFSAADYWRRVETDVYFNTDNWRHLRRRPAACEQAALETLEEVHDVMAQAGTGGPAELQDQILTLDDLEDRLQRELGQLLLVLGHGRAWSALDFTGLGHYAEQRLGLSRSAARNRVTVARGLLGHPLVRQAYEDGRLRFEATVLILRVLRRGGGAAGDATEQAWVDHASHTTLKRLRDEARLLCQARHADGRRGSARPLGTREWHASLRLAPGDFRARLRRLGTQATAENRIGALRLQLPRQLADDFFAAIESRRQLLTAAMASEIAASGQPAQDGAQMFSSADPRGRAGSESFPDIGQSDTAGAQLSAGHGQAERPSAQLSSKVGQPGRPGAHGSAPDSLASRVPWSDDSVALQAARMLTRRGGRLPLWVGLLALLEDYIETWDDPHAVPHREAQAIYIRDGWRCTAPGCTSRRHLESHHIVYRSQGGAVKDEANQICLCQFHHHQGEHGELASCQGSAPLGVVWRLGHPSVGTWFQNEMRL